MIDFVKLEVRLPNYQFWRSKVSINFSRDVDEDGVFLSQDYQYRKTYTYRAEFKNMKLILKETVHHFSEQNETKEYLLFVHGSLHSSFKGGKNFEVFTFTQLQATIAWLCKELRILPESCIIRNLEFGYNLKVDFHVREFLNKYLMLYKGKEFNGDKLTDSRGRSVNRTASLSQYSLKVYDKGFQNNLSYQLLRIELHFNKMQVLNQLGVYTLASLLDPSVLHKLHLQLEKSWKNVLIDDPCFTPDVISQLTDKQRSQLDKWQNTRKMTELHQSRPEGGPYYYDEVQRFKKLTKKLGGTLHPTIGSLISESWFAFIEN